MSRSENNEQLKNPARVFLKWDGTNGGFNYWDKDKKANVHVKLPVTFMVLDTMATIKGFSDKEQTGFWSNEIKTRNISKDQLVVRIKDKSDPAGKKTKIVAKGLYSEVMADKGCTGAKYCQSVYIAFQDNGKYEIANIQMTGSALSSWIDFAKNNDVLKGAITVAKMTEGKKGVTKYKIPTFEKIEAPEGAEAKAIELDIVLKAYFEKYFNNRQKEEEVATSTEQSA